MNGRPAGRGIVSLLEQVLRSYISVKLVDLPLPDFAIFWLFAD
jgi:hypothetical protein